MKGWLFLGDVLLFFLVLLLSLRFCDSDTPLTVNSEIIATTINVDPAVGGGGGCWVTSALESCI